MKNVVLALLLASVIGLVTLGVLDKKINIVYTESGEYVEPTNPPMAFPSPTAMPVKEPSKPLKVEELDLRKGNVVLLVDDVNVRSADAVIEDIRAANKKRSSQPIYLLLDSPGGSVLDGRRIITAIKESRNKVYTVCLQLCASMAAMILEYGYERYAVDGSIVMFHPASVMTIVSGELDKIVSRFSFLKLYVDKMDHFVAARSGQTYDQFKAKSMRELWIDAEDALRQNYIDKIVSVDVGPSYDIPFGENKARQKVDLSW